MIEIAIHGRGGQGAVIASQILSYAFFLEGSYSHSFPTFGAERRGAPVAAFVRVSDRFINNRYIITNANYLILLSEQLIDIIDIKSNLKEKGVVIINSDKEANKFKNIDNKIKIIIININRVALKNNLGTTYMPIVNVPILGVFAKYTGLVKLDSLVKSLPRFVPFSLENNILALKEAYRLAGSRE